MRDKGMRDKGMRADGIKDPDANGGECNIWLMVDHDGERTLFRLVEVGNGSDVLKLASDLRAPAVAVDIALPPLPAFETPPGRRRSAKSRLILLKLHTVPGDDANGAVVRKSPQDEARQERRADSPTAARLAMLIQPDRGCDDGTLLASM